MKIMENSISKHDAAVSIPRPGSMPRWTRRDRARSDKLNRLARGIEALSPGAGSAMDRPRQTAQDGWIKIRNTESTISIPPLSAVEIITFGIGNNLEPYASVQRPTANSLPPQRVLITGTTPLDKWGWGMARYATRALICQYQGDEPAGTEAMGS